MVPLTLVKYDDFTNSQIVNYTTKIAGAFFYCKGQLISKFPFGVFKSSKKPKNFFPGFLP